METERFKNDAFPKQSTFETVFETLRFQDHQRFRAFQCGRYTKLHQKYAFSNENALVWMRPNYCDNFPAKNKTNEKKKKKKKTRKEKAKLSFVISLTEAGRSCVCILSFAFSKTGMSVS